mmetsp:Transcript_17067/g.36878  ORF Transcript_17067/g.36878 Transcript_17067/m.36878 type:complete len:372 (+) Transcript_17067:86-1201(+)
MTANVSSGLLDEFRSASLNPQLLQSLLHRLLSHPKIHNGFVDVLKLPSVRKTLDELDDGKRTALVKTVELFAFGTVREYHRLKEEGGESVVWTLNDVQLEKLRMLSVASIARGQIEEFHSEVDGGVVLSSSGCGDVEMTDNAPFRQQKLNKTEKGKKKKDGNGMLSIPYYRLASELRIPDDGGTFDERSTRQLEDLLIQCVYSNVLAAKLDQSSRSLRLEPHVALARDDGSGPSGGVCGSVISRDLNTLAPESARAEATRMISTLKRFLKRSDDLLSTLECSREATQTDRREDEARWREVRRVVEESPSRMREAALAGVGGMQGMGMGMGGGGMMGSGEPMEVVDMAGRRQVKRSKGGHSMMMGGGGVRFG